MALSLISTVVMLYLTQVQSMYVNLLGKEVQFPLIFWDFRDVHKLINENSTLSMECQNQKRYNYDPEEQYGKFLKCSERFTDTFEDAGPFLHLPESNELKLSFSDACQSSFGSLHCCMSEVINNLIENCSASLTTSEFLEDALAFHKAIINQMCESNAIYYIAFKNMGGSECVTKMKDRLATCVDTFSMENMTYDTTGCRKSWAFVKCVDRYLSRCDTKMAEIAVNFITAGLMETPCSRQCAAYSQCHRYHRFKRGLPSTGHSFALKGAAGPTLFVMMIKPLLSNLRNMQ